MNKDIKYCIKDLFSYIKVSLYWWFISTTILSFLLYYNDLYHGFIHVGKILFIGYLLFHLILVVFVPMCVIVLDKIISSFIDN